MEKLVQFCFELQQKHGKLDPFFLSFTSIELEFLFTIIIVIIIIKKTSFPIAKRRKNIQAHEKKSPQNCSLYEQ